MHVFLQFVVLTIFNICLLFDLLFAGLHVAHDVINASFYLSLHAPLYVPKS